MSGSFDAHICAHDFKIEVGVGKIQQTTFQMLRAHHFSKGLRAPFTVNIQFKVHEVKIQFPDV